MIASDVQAQERETAQRIGQRLRQLRQEAGMTLRDLAQQIGLRDHTILLKYERGQTPPTIARIVSLARVLNCSAAALLARDDRAMPLITAVDQADEMELAQLSFVLETLSAPSQDAAT
jgi:transcriptional regulator with XRE-family HTH domain